MGLMTSIDNIDKSLPPMFNWLQPEGSLEAIKFQANSTFPAELTELFQRIIDFGNEHDNFHGKPDSSESALMKHTRMKTFMLEDIDPKLTVIVKKHTGIDVKEFIHSLPTSTDAICSIYCWLSGADEVVIKVLNSANGYSEDELRKSKTFSEMVGVSRSLDRNKGKILNSVKFLAVKIGLPVGIFCVRDFLPNTNDDVQFRASEITAIILHEIGHVFGWVEYAADLSYVGYYGNNSLRAIDDKFKKDKVSITKEVLKSTDRIAGGVDNKSLHEFIANSKLIMSNALNAILVYDDVTPDSNDQLIYKWNFLIVVVSTIIRFLTGISMIINLPVMYIVSYLFDCVNFDTSKASRELVNTSTQYTMYERLADEYVSRFKMSRYLNDGLNRLGIVYDALEKYGYGSPVFSNILRNSMILRLISIISLIPHNFFYSILGIVVGGKSSYEADSIRLRRNVNNMIDLLKDSKIDASVRNEIVFEIDKMNRDIKNQSSFVLDTLNSAYRFIVALPANSITKLFSSTIGDTSINSEYVKLFTKLDDMLSNKSFYYSVKMYQLFEEH